MEKPEIQVRRAGTGDAADVARLLHDFNTEFSKPTPGVEELTKTVRPLIEQDKITVLLAEEDPARDRPAALPARHLELPSAARALYESMEFTNREGAPDGPSMLFYEREI